VRSVVDAQRRTFEALGCVVEDAEPDLTGADEGFKALRGWDHESLLAEEYEKHRDKLKPTVVWGIEQGRRLTGPQLGRAEVLRTAIYHRVREFLGRYEFLVVPTVQGLAFDVN